MFAQADFPYSLKNIPIPNKNSYMKCLLSKTESFIQRLRWKTYYYLNPDKRKNDLDTYGFKTEKSAPQVKELVDFENDLYSAIDKLEFCNPKSSFQEQLNSDVKKIKQSKNIFILGDKTPNVYEVEEPNYNKLLHNSITSHYKKSDDNTELEINREARDIVRELKIADRVDKLSKSECYITLKDHKQHFQDNPKVRLINPAKTNIGQISKIYLQEINEEILKQTNLNQWRSTSEVIDWFNNIDNKSRSSFLILDIVDFYPSISEKLLDKAIDFAQTVTSISPNKLKTIRNARKTLLFNQGIAWQKTTGLSDVTQGGLDSCQVCELVGLYLLNLMRDRFPMMNFGLYRDDGLASHRRIPGPTLDRYRKGIEDLFLENELKITIATGLKHVDFLDVTFNLSTETYRPYKKPNSKLLYVNKDSNHPPTVLKQIPNSVNQRLSTISSSEEIFNASKREYESALSEAGYKQPLKYTINEQNNANNRRKRKRNIVWYNPPFSKSVKGNLGCTFLKLLNKHFPKDNKLHKIINRNTVKLSYSTMSNMKRIIQSHNSKLSNKNEKKAEKTCSCPNNKKETCPLDNKCLSSAIVYQATMERTGHFYVGLCETEFKKRYAKHKFDFKHEACSKSTTLASHVWCTGQNGEPAIKWKILKQSTPRKPGDKECQLCLEEKLLILKNSRDPLCLNRRSELSNRCVIFHRTKHKLDAIE